MYKIVMNYTETRPWGLFENLLERDDCKVKIITVKPGQAPSYQSHEHRCERYVIVQGEATITLDDVETVHTKGDIVVVDYKQKHRVRCTSDEDLIFIEVQLGTYFGEDDIVRHSDDYNRN
jgi:mannose-6-phosphate isomerase-like protein (cupin superfamily)